MKVSATLPTLCLIALVSAASARAQTAPAFDCSKAEHDIERTICADPALAEKDRKLAAVYQQARAAMQRVDVGGRAALKDLKTTQHGWIKGRNECWKAADKRRCTADAYDRRIAYLQARYFLVKGASPVFYVCNANPADEIVATFIATNPPSVRLERGDRQEIGILSPSGKRYDAAFGVTFAMNGEQATVAWPQHNTFTCVTRK
jgi:uncharacterized protein